MSQPAVLPGTAITIPCYHYNDKMVHSNTTRISPIRSLLLTVCKSSHLIRITDAIPSNLTFVCPCIAKIFSEHNKQDANFFNLFIFVRRSTCFRRFFRPSSGAQNCTYSVRYLSDQYCYLLLAGQSSSR